MINVIMMIKVKYHRVALARHVLLRLLSLRSMNGPKMNATPDDTDEGKLIKCEQKMCAETHCHMAVAIIMATSVYF